MAERSKPSTSWSALKRVLKNWPPSGLVSLLHELYELNPDNRDFLHARLLPDRPAIALDSVKRKLRQFLSPGAILDGGFSGRELKRIIDQYAKANDDPSAVADLLVSDLEAALVAFNQVGDFEPLVDHIYSVLSRLDKLLPKLSAEAGGPVLSRITALAIRWQGEFGYGISDELSDYAHAWNRTRGREKQADGAKTRAGLKQ